MTILDIWQDQYGSNFRMGVELLKKHNPTAVTSRILERLQQVAYSDASPTEYEWGKLTAALGKTAIPNQQSDSTILITTGGGGPSEPVNFTATFRTETPKPNTTAHAKALHKEHAHVHASMTAATTDTERAGYAQEIMENIIPELDNEYAKLRGESPRETTGKAERGATEKLRQLNSIRTRISRLRNALIPGEKDKARRAQVEAELADKIAKRDALEAELA